MEAPDLAIVYVVEFAVLTAAFSRRTTSAPTWTAVASFEDGMALATILAQANTWSKWGRSPSWLRSKPLT
jgi:hypothetical protein